MPGVMLSGDELQDEEAAKKRDGFQFNRGSDDPPIQDNRVPRSHGASARSSRNNIDRTPSLDSDNLILVVSFLGLPCVQQDICLLSP